MARVLGINGIRTDGADNTDRMLNALHGRGHETVDTNYPLTNILRGRPRSLQFADAKRLMKFWHKDGDAVVAHSRGCLVNLRMMELGAKFSTLFWFRPAMNRDYIIPKGACERLFVIHSPDDRAIWMGERLWWHDFGAAGRLGLYAGDQAHDLYDQRVINHQAPEYKEHEFMHHSDDFLQPNIGPWIEFVHDQLRRQDDANG